MEKGMVSADLLRRLRNDLPMRFTIAALDREGPPSKMREGRFVFLCPQCGEMLVAVNPRNNLAHCFGCGKNFNNIDLLLACDFDFRSAVARLERLLNEYLSRRSKHKTTDPK
jgi:DNA primase